MDIRAIAVTAAVISGISAVASAADIGLCDGNIPGGAFVRPELNPVPKTWKWISGNEVIFSYDGSYTDSTAFIFDASRKKIAYGASAPEKYSSFPVRPEGAVNLTYSPDSTMLAFTRDNDLYVTEIATGREHRLTFDGTDLILNGYASWVYYEEILGRPSKYKAFWWSPDSRKIGFYRFDNTEVPLFPIYSPFGQDGSLRQTRYPKAGETNPQVRIGIVDIVSVCNSGKNVPVVWADFDPEDDQYFGIPFWGADSKDFFIARMPRIQNTLDLYAVSAADGSKRHIYNETYRTWVDWITEVIFTEEGLYMARAFETGWQQIYFLSYDGGRFRRLTDGPNWSVSLERVDEASGEVYFTAQRDSRVRSCLYKADRKGRITALTDTSCNVSGVSFSPDGKYFAASLSNMSTPVKVVVARTSGAAATDLSDRRSCTVVADMAPEGIDLSGYAMPELVWMTTEWWSDNGIIQVVADCRAAGNSGRAGTDMVYRNLTEWPVRDFIAWADYLKGLPYVDGDRIGVEGFSFGGTMTAMLLFRASESYNCGVAGGGVYDWALYDSHYTERFMETPQTNPEGYASARVLNYVSSYPVGTVPAGSASSVPGTHNAKQADVMLKITHGTGDDNVHFQNTLQLVDELQRNGKRFDFMVYPDGMHGYRGYQATHFRNENRAFWLMYLKGSGR